MLSQSLLLFLLWLFLSTYCVLSMVLVLKLRQQTGTIVALVEYNRLIGRLTVTQHVASLGLSVPLALTVERKEGMPLFP